MYVSDVDEVVPAATTTKSYKNNESLEVASHHSR